jgi:hypothetical protein
VNDYGLSGAPAEFGSLVPLRDMEERIIGMDPQLITRLSVFKRDATRSIGPALLHTVKNSGRNRLPTWISHVDVNPSGKQ